MRLHILNYLCDLQFELRLRVENAIVLIKMTAIVRVKLLHSRLNVTSVPDEYSMGYVWSAISSDSVVS